MKKQKKRNQSTLSQRKPSNDLELVSITGISVVFGDKFVQLAPDWQYEVQDASTQTPVLLTVPQIALDKLKAVTSKTTTLGVSPNSEALIASTWPQNWNYLLESQLHELTQKGLIKTEYLLMESIAHIQFGEFVFSQINIERFLDTLTEIAWIDYVIRQHLFEYRKIYKPQYVTLDMDYEFNRHVAKCWMTLENCVIRIAGLWDRIRSYLLPLYFFGKSFDDMSISWSDLHKQILQIVSTNTNQKVFYELLAKAWREFENSDFKNLRNRVVHEFVYRPPGAVPTGTNDIPALNTIEDLHKLVLSELDKAREVIIIFTAMMVSKTPKNVLQNKFPT